MQNLDIVAILKAVGLPGIVVMAWIYDTVTGIGQADLITWFLLLGVSVGVSTIMHWQLQARPRRMETQTTLRADHQVLADHLNAQTQVLLAIEASLDGHLSLRSLLTFIPVAICDLKWVAETSIRNALGGAMATAMVSEAAVARNLEIVLMSRVAELSKLSSVFKNRDSIQDLKQVASSIVSNVYGRLQGKSHELSGSDAQFIWEAVDTHLNTYGDTLVSRVQEDLLEIDEGLRHLILGSAPSTEPQVVTTEGVG